MMSDERPYPDISFAAEEGLEAKAGKKLQSEKGLKNDTPIIDALRTVYDPEIPINLYDLGLIYDIERKEEGDVAILMTLTAPACPVAGEMPKMVARAVAAIDHVSEVVVTLTWNPAWTPERMSEDARTSLGM